MDRSLPGSPSVGFPRQECWSRLPCPPPGDLPDPGMNTHLLHWQAGSLPLSYQEVPQRGSPLSLTFFLQLLWLEISCTLPPSHTPSLQPHQDDTWLSIRLTEDTLFALKRSLTAPHSVWALLDYSPLCLPRSASQDQPQSGSPSLRGSQKAELNPGTLSLLHRWVLNSGLSWPTHMVVTTSQGNGDNSKCEAEMETILQWQKEFNSVGSRMLG